MQDTQRTLVDLAGVFASQFRERILTPGLRSRDQDAFWSFHPPPRFVLVNTSTATGDSREGLLSTLKVVIRKKAKKGGPFSFEIESTETRRRRNQVDLGILQQGFPLGGCITPRVYRRPCGVNYAKPGKRVHVLHQAKAFQRVQRESAFRGSLDAIN